MRRLKSFEELFKRLIAEQGDKFLGIFDKKALQELEKSGKHLGSQKSWRPFIGKLEGEVYKLVFLSSQHYSKLFVPLHMCNTNKGLCQKLKSECFAFQDKEEGRVLCYLLRKERLEELNPEICGSCKDLEFLENLKEVWISV